MAVLALTLYGDLDLSLLDERPPGRTGVRTAQRPASARATVLEFVRVSGDRVIAKTFESAVVKAPGLPLSVQVMGRDLEVDHRRHVGTPLAIGAERLANDRDGALRRHGGAQRGKDLTCIAL